MQDLAWHGRRWINAAVTFFYCWNLSRLLKLSSPYLMPGMTTP